ncbi:MAG: molybdopterin molybdenumtransferase MoeA, partial [Gammaproteobacteria bacterium]
PATLRRVGTALAGHPFEGSVEPGECVRIMTGAPLPEGADTVVMQEAVETEGEMVRVPAGLRPGENVRMAGEDIRRGQPVLEPGRRLTAADLGLLASVGIAEVNVFRPLRVAFFSTGDELRSIGERLRPGDVYDSNRYTLHGMLARLGAQRLDLGVVPDDPATMRRTFEEAAREADVVITSGGVSVGEADYVKGILEELGEVGFWKIAIKPGRPLAFGRVGEAVFFGLPGNPVSVMVTFYQFVQPALRRMQGEPPAEPLLVRARTVDRLKKRPGRTEFQRGRMERDTQGELTVSSVGNQGSGVLSSMHRANCFIILEPDRGGVEPGELVTVQPFDGLI